MNTPHYILRRTLYCLMSILPLAFTSCEGDLSQPIDRQPAIVELAFSTPNDIKVKPQTVEVQFKDQETGIISTYTCGLEGLRVQLPAGLYDIDLSATPPKGSPKQIKKFVAAGSLIPLREGVQQLFYELRPQTFGQFKITELCFSSGRENESKNAFMWGTYAIITNTTDSVCYADSLVLASAAANTLYDYNEIYYQYLPAIGISFMAMIPGGGKDHPVQPGKSLLLVCQAQNHNLIASNVPDMTIADFEWYDDTSWAAAMLPDNPQVPNLTTLWRENEYLTMLVDYMSIFIFKLPMSYNELLDKHGILTPYANPYIPAVILPYIPDTWVQDGVQVSGDATLLQRAFPISVDKSHTWVSRMFDYLVVRRKQRQLPNGKMEWVDTNNSTEDFLRDQKTSLLK